MWNRRKVIAAGTSVAALAGLGSAAFAQAQAQAVVVDLSHDIGPLEHIWSRCAGSDRAEITLRESWRRDARRAQREIGIERVRFHGILDDELGVGPKSFLPTVGFNFQNVDAVYDGLLDLGLRPFVELSFMPAKLASGTQAFGLYHANVTPPQSMADWQSLIEEFARHLLARYGPAEVRQWYFEVWNEPNLSPFWSGTQAQYFELYRAAAVALKTADPALKVGGPATATAQWIPAFLDYCAQSNAPLDFVSTHLYAGDNQTHIFGEAGKYSQNDMIPAAVALVREQIDATQFKGIPLWLDEWSSDSPAMIAHVITHCLPYCQAMSHWQVSGSFEEIMVPSWVIKEGDNGWGLFAARSIARPAFNTYKLMNRLGVRQLQAVGPALATRLPHGRSAVLIWNLAEATQAAGIPGASSVRKVQGEARRLQVTLHGAASRQPVKVSYVDQTRGSPYPAWRALGSPTYPTTEQLAKIRLAAEIAPPEERKVGSRGELAIDLPPEGVALLEL